MKLFQQLKKISGADNPDSENWEGGSKPTSYFPAIKNGILKFVFEILYTVKGKIQGAMLTAFLRQKYYCFLWLTCLVIQCYRVNPF